MWEQIKSSITFADILKVFGGFITGVVIVIGVYFTFDFRVKNVEQQTNELNARMLNLNKRQEEFNNRSSANWNKFSERMDRRYVQQREFENFKEEWSWRFIKIDKNIDRLLELHLQSIRIREIPDVPVSEQKNK